MKLSMKSVIAGAAALAVTGGMLLVGGGSAIAAGPPTFEPDPGSAGSLSFYDATGAQIGGGLVSDAPLATYYKASGPKIGATDTKAFIVYYTPQNAVPTGSWTTGEQWTAPQTFATSQAGYPAGLNNPATNVVVKGSAADGPFSTHITDFANADAADPGIYQIRMYTSAGASTYYSADILVSGTSWTQVFPALPAAVATTTTLSTSPASPQTVGTNVTLTAHVVPASGTITNGNVQFFDGATQIGATQAFTGADVSISTTALTAGTHSLTAKYLPAGLSFSGSTSAAKSYVLTGVVTPTTTALSVNPGSSTAFSPVVLTATVTPGTAPGTVTFTDGAALIGTTAPGTSPFALTTSALAEGDHTITATFTPTDPTAFGSSNVTGTVFHIGPSTGATPDIQSIRVTIAPGTLVISTPYDAAHPLDLGTMALNGSATQYSANAPFTNISVTDTRPGNLPWTVQAQASPLTSGTNAINGENVGLTAMSAVGIPGNALQPGPNISAPDNPAASPAVGPTDAGTLGLGNAFHTVAHANAGLGSISFNGLLTVNAPTSTLPGTYQGTITFTLS